MSLLLIFRKTVVTQVPALPNLDILERKKNAVLSRWPDVVVTPPDKDRERLVQEMLRRLNANEWDDTPMSFVTSAARALFDAERRERPDLSKLRDFYYEEMRASKRRSFLDAMLSVYLAS